MATDLKKMVEEWYKAGKEPREVTSDLYETLKAMAAEIEKLKRERNG